MEMEMIPDWIKLAIQIGFAPATLIFLFWKGIPWYAEKEAKNREVIEALMNNHLEDMKNLNKAFTIMQQENLSAIHKITSSLDKLTDKQGSDDRAVNEILKVQVAKQEEILYLIKEMKNKF